MKKYAVTAAGALGALTPLVALAQGPELTNIKGLIGVLGLLVDLLIPIAFGIGLLFFFWGLAKYILASGDEGKKEEGKNIMIWGVIALFIMASIWGIVRFIQGAFGIEQTSQESQEIPGVIR